MDLKIPIQSDYMLPTKGHSICHALCTKEQFSPIKVSSDASLHKALSYFLQPMQMQFIGAYIFVGSSFWQNGKQFVVAYCWMPKVME